MKFTKEELNELDDYLLALAPETKYIFRECGEIMDLSVRNVVLYKAMVNVVRSNDKDVASTSKEVVYFVETHEHDLRKTTDWREAIFGALVYDLVQTFTENFEVVSNVVNADYPRTVQ